MTYNIQNVIDKKSYIDEVLAKYPEIIEVYCNEDFSLHSTEATIYVRLTNEVCYSRLLEDLVKAFPGKLLLYCTYTGLHISLVGKQLMWKSGRWYYDY